MDKRGLGEVVSGGDVVRHRVVDRQRNHGRPHRIRLQVRWVVSRGHTSIHMSAEDLMDSDDIVHMAREAGFAIQGDMYGEDDEIARVKRFAKLVAAAEREACADIAENWRCNGMPRTVLADQIRARGQA
jgi:hypothetical protein